MQKYSLEFVVFICGAGIMIMELVGSRILAPFVGTSIVTWTSLIGIILAALSFGYHKGGQLADKNPSKEKLAHLIFLASLGILTIIALRLPVFLILEYLQLGLIYRSVAAAIILFVIPSYLFGTVSPFAAKLKIDSVKKSGGVVGNLYALSTVGSIAGTFITGFYLISTFTAVQILFAISSGLMFCVVLLDHKEKYRLIVKLAIFILVGTMVFVVDRTFQPSKVLALDTQYNNVMIYETIYKDKKIRVMSLDGKYDSGMYPDSDELVFDYSRFYNLIEDFTPTLNHVLVMGGAGYTTPKDLLKRYPKLKVDVVEIDPKLTDLAKQYFGLKEDPRLTLFHEDGRTFLNRVSKEQPKKYSAILLDVFKGYSMPFQLTTQESMQEVANLLEDDGVVLANVISAIDGDGGKFLRAQYATLKTIFPEVYVIPVTHPQDGTQVQNLMLVGFKTAPGNLKFTNQENEINFKNKWQKPINQDLPILTDNFAPVDQYMLQTLF